MLSVVVLISGTGSNLLALLKAADHPLYPVRVLAVGSDRAAEGLAHADLYGAPTFVVEPTRFSDTEAWSKKLQETIEHFNPDLVVLAGFMRILPPSFIDRFGPNIINTHPSLLPLFPGAHAVRDALAAGAQETGVTMHVVDKGVDTGPIIAQKTVTVMPADDEASLHERIKVEERQLLVDTVLSIAEKRTELVSRLG
jgi:phosphoribosylglycinamide formyltransferase-1